MLTMKSVAWVSVGFSLCACIYVHVPIVVVLRWEALRATEASLLVLISPYSDWIELCKYSLRCAQKRTETFIMNRAISTEARCLWTEVRIFINCYVLWLKLNQVNKNNNNHCTAILPSQLNPLQPGEQSHWYVPCASVHVPPFWHGFIGRHLDSTNAKQRANLSFSLVTSFSDYLSVLHRAGKTFNFTTLILFITQENYLAVSSPSELTSFYDIWAPLMVLIMTSSKRAIPNEN